MAEEWAVTSSQSWDLLQYLRHLEGLRRPLSLSSSLDHQADSVLPSTAAAAASEGHCFNQPRLVKTAIQKAELGLGKAT